MRVLRAVLAASFLMVLVPCGRPRPGSARDDHCLPGRRGRSGSDGDASTSPSRPTRPQRVDLAVDPAAGRLGHHAARRWLDDSARSTPSRNPESPLQINAAAFDGRGGHPRGCRAGLEPGHHRGPTGAAGTTVQLTLDITIEAVEAGAVTMDVRLPDPERSGRRRHFTLRPRRSRNGTNQQITLSLRERGPAGWRVDARPGGDTRRRPLSSTPAACRRSR